jgi:putative ABC transport system permease protein
VEKKLPYVKFQAQQEQSLPNNFLAEALLVTILSVMLSIALVNVLLPAFNSFTGKDLTINLHTDFRIWIGVFLVITIVTLLAGLYPALFQSGLNPLSLLKSKIQLSRGNISLRRSLVVSSLRFLLFLLQLL